MWLLLVTSVCGWLPIWLLVFSTYYLICVSIRLGPMLKLETLLRQSASNMCLLRMDNKREKFL